MAKRNGLWQRLCRWLHGIANAMGALRVVRLAHYALPLICLGLLGPFFELWAGEFWLWAVWVLLIAAWALCAMVLHGERLELRETATERTKETVGLLWALVGEVGRRRLKEVRPSEFRVHVLHVQGNLLRHLVQAMSDALRIPDIELHANWMTLDGDVLATKVRDRPVENRPAIRRLSLGTDVRGAAAAAKNAVIYIESDTQEGNNYGERLPYRSFISVPILMGERVIGVVNVDALRPSVFDDTLEWRIKEVGYIIGLLEVECWEE
jgi:hypothetical protein